MNNNEYVQCLLQNICTHQKKFQIMLLSFLTSILGCRNYDERPKSKSIDPVQISMEKNAAILLSDSLITSVSIGIYRKGVKYTSHYGELDIGRGNTPTDQTLYEIASVSKTLTGILVANAVLERKLNLEDNIQNYLEDNYENFEFHGNPIRIKHLVTHTSGMSKFLPESINTLFEEINEDLPFKIHEIQKTYSKKDFLHDLHTVRLDTTPGIKYQYSNIDTELMAEILENIYDKRFNEIVKNYFRKNVGMLNTSIDLPAGKEKFLANGYGMTGKRVPHEVVIYGADGGVKTTMSDLVNYIEFQLDKTDETVIESHKTLYHEGNKKMGYYLPIHDSEEYGTYFRMHGGAFGSQNLLFIIPKYELGISVITNQSGLETSRKLLGVVNGLINDLK